MQNELYQEENQDTRGWLEEESTACLDLLHQKQYFDEYLLEKYHETESFSFFINIAEETRDQTHQLHNQSEEGIYLLQKEYRRLEDENDELYEQEIRAKDEE